MKKAAIPGAKPQLKFYGEDQEEANGKSPRLRLEGPKDR
jgi:hypothetical protein